MKNLKLRFVSMCIASLLTLGLSYAFAQAQCADVDAGGTVYGNYDCRLETSCGGYCYYNCTCSNVMRGYTCDDVLKEAGFELVDESTPICV
jgi:hypothetical protein